MFRLPVLKSSADLWQVLGSATGYVGSDQFPPFLKFLVDHSGGRYVLKEEEGPRGTQTSIHQNPKWAEGKNIEGALPPESAVVFVNEFHNWSKKSKDNFLKQALEKGIFEVNNPNGGLDKIYVPVTFIIATNEGLELVTSRDIHGTRFGKPLNYEQMLEKWELYHRDISVLKESLSASNKRSGAFGGDKESPGISEELINRLPNSGLHLMRPQSPEILQEIARMKLGSFAFKMSQARGEYGQMTITWDEEVPRFIQEFRYVPEDNARPIGDKVNNLIESTIFKAYKDELIANNDRPKKLHLRVEMMEDYTSELVVDLEQEGQRQTLRLPIAATESEKARAPLTDEALEELISLDEKMRRQLFGVDHVIERLAKAELESAEGRNGVLDISQAKHPAKSYMFLGLSSTGKTETAKVLAEARYGSRSALVTIDFSQIQTVHDLKIKILGTTDGAGNPIPSEFMKHYDRNQGKLVFVFDEVANTPLEVLKALYDIFREPVVTTFSDGKDRIMGNTTIILTGNAGEEWYADLPKNLPEWMLMTAMNDIYERMMRSPGLQRATLEKYFSPAFVNRLGMRNIFFFPPLNHKAIRQLTMLKTKLALDELKGGDSVRGWDVIFPSKSNFLALVDAIEHEGFILSEQGASIDRFVKEDFAAELRVLLLNHKVPSNTKVLIGLHPETGYLKDPGKKSVIRLSVYPEGYVQPLTLDIEGKLQPRKLHKSPTSRMLVAYHEAGHELVGRYYLGDSRQTEVISITSGVAQIEGHFVPYDGIVESRPTQVLDENRQVMLRELAGLFGGEVAQTLVTKGRRNDSGKSNDMERAARWARSMVLSQGLSDEWGLETIPSGESQESYVQSLPEERKHLLNKIVRNILDEARGLAEKALIANYDHMIDLGMTLARKGELKREDLDKFYEGRKIVTESSYSRWNLGVMRNRVKYAVQGLYRASTRDAELLPWVPTSPTIAEPLETFQENKFNQIKGVRVMDEIPIVRNREKWAGALAFFDNIKALPSPCEELLTGKE
ncbi:MAG: AAA family ATPase [Bdellovibrionales bacterium]|nr:AAA family ATPase [Bdellovibrionales bacterium]